MKNAFFTFLYLAILAGCQTSGKPTDDTTALPPGERLSITGDFNGDQIADTLFESYFSQVFQREIPKEPYWEDYEKNLEQNRKTQPLARLFCTMPGADTFALGASFLSHLSNLGDLDGEPGDEAGYIADHADFSNLNTFHVLTFKDRGFKKIFSFSVNEMFCFDPEYLFDNGSIIQSAGPKTIEYKFYSDTGTVETGRHVFQELADTGGIKKISKQYDEYMDHVEIDYGYKYDQSILAGLEQNRNTSQLSDFLIQYLGKVQEWQNFPNTRTDMIQYLYEIDINADNEKDIIYHGPAAGEGFMTMIFLQQRDTFELIFIDYQYIIDITFYNKKLTSIALTDPGCCADPQVVDRYYRVTHDAGTTLFQLIKAIGYLTGFEKLPQKFPVEKNFTVTKQGASLRSQCFEYDGIHDYYGENGNVIARYDKGFKGTALGQKVENGVSWLYVLMDKKVKFDDQDFPAFERQPTNLSGWMREDETDLK